jgi:hypothetical protein
MDEQGREFLEDYMAGHYDRTCERCGGAGKIKVPDRQRMTKVQRKEWDAKCQADAECYSERMWERRMLGDWR